MSQEEELLQLRADIERLKNACSDLEIALDTAIEHGDAVQSELELANRQLQKEIGERVALEKELRLVVSAISRNSQDLEVVLHAITEHSDQLDRQWLDRYVLTESAANTDPLTGLANRRMLDRALEKEWARARRGGDVISIIVADIDFFKPYNDNYGHQQGDDCLARVAEVLRRPANRECDIAARYGGEEFVLVLPYTGVGGACHVAESIIKDMCRLAIPHAHSPVADYLTLSLGIYSTVPGDEDACSLFAEADRQLYLAKQRGRNRYEVAVGKQQEVTPNHLQET